MSRCFRFARRSAVLLAATCAFTSLGPLLPAAAAQEALRTPWASPRAQVSQEVGISTVTIDYGRPAVKGRAIWGGLVPWGKVWRAGANENTTFTLTDDANIEGHPLAAGVYGLHLLPREQGVTLIFSNNSTSWGSFTYDETEDALRVEVKAVEAPMAEWLSYEFDELTSTSALCRLHWEKRAVPFHITFDTPTIVLANARDSYLRDRPGFSAGGWANAASYCLQSGVDLEEGLSWAERAVSMESSFSNLNLQAALLDKLGRATEAVALRAKALPLATEVELNALGYQQLQAGQLDAAIATFETNSKQHPESWNAWDSLGEGLQTKGDKVRAREAYGKALTLVAAANDAGNKARIEKVLKEL
jgi:tetratricopeptide (TPR) repeat protein